MSNSTVWRRGLMAMIAGVLGPLGVHAQGLEPVRIGLITSQSGTFSQQGAEIERAVGFAVEAANAAGGIDGRKVEVRTADDEGTPDAGRRGAEKLARDGFNLLIGPVASSISLALNQNLDRWDALYFNIASKSDRLTGDTCKARHFRTNHSDAMDLAMITEWAKDFKEKNFAVVASDYVWGRDSGESFMKAAKAQGKNVPLALYVPVGTKDFSPYIAQLNASNAEAIWVALAGRDAIAFVKQAKEFGLMPAKKLIGHVLINNFIVNATDDALDGTLGTTAYTPDLDTPANKAFVGAWKAKFNRLPTDSEGQAYNGVKVIFDGVRAARSVKPADIAKSLSGATLDTLYGPARMRAEDHQLVLPNFVGRVKRVDGVERAVIERQFPASLTPAPSPLCKL